MKKEITFTHAKVKKLVDRDFKDPTGIELSLGEPEICAGNGKEDPMKCCCDECDYFLKCFPEWRKDEAYGKVVS